MHMEVRLPFPLAGERILNESLLDPWRLATIYKNVELTAESESDETEGSAMDKWIVFH